MKRGYITIATGNKYYYYLANNLLKSYKFFTKKPMPFFILCQEENEYTKDFDKAIILDNPYNSFMDKLFLIKNLPNTFDEIIFIDADSLLFGDLNDIWKYFENSDNFSAFGQVSPINETIGNIWYETKNIGKFGQNVNYRCRIHAGVLFFRNTDKLNKIHSDCIELLNEYDNLTFNCFKNNKDEMIFSIVSALNNCKPIQEPFDFFVYTPCRPNYTANISKGQFELNENNNISNCTLIHFGTENTRLYSYKKIVSELDFMIKHKLKINYNKNKLTFFSQLKYNFLLTIFKIRKKLKR